MGVLDGERRHPRSAPGALPRRSEHDDLPALEVLVKLRELRGAPDEARIPSVRDAERRAIHDETLS
jgi:hypothetical protein